MAVYSYTMIQPSPDFFLASQQQKFSSQPMKRIIDADTAERN